jgi:hypothetical protein
MLLSTQYALRLVLTYVALALVYAACHADTLDGMGLVSPSKERTNMVKSKTSKVAPKIVPGSKKPVNTTPVAPPRPQRIKLSKARLDTLSMISDPQARAELRSKWEAAIVAQMEKNSVFLQRRENMEFPITDRGFLALNGTGTRRNAILRLDKAEELVERFEEFKAQVAELRAQHDAGTYDDTESGVDGDDGDETEQA